METNPIIYVLLNKSLNMSAGKAASQAAHAVAMLKPNQIEAFTESFKRTVIVLEAKDQQQMENLWTYLQDAGLYCRGYVDEGANEVNAYSLTALAVEPIDADDNKMRAIFEKFCLYSGHADPYEEAIESLTQIRWNRQFGLEDNTPWHFRRTQKWLKRNRNK